jgi:mannose-6-phosphate isomerase
VTRTDFERRIQDGSVAECFHRVPVRAGDAMFLPSGRVHAIGAGLVIFEIQQNSDTTYRVFDWNRVGLDGQPRELHIKQALASIDFNDVEPSLVKSSFKPAAELLTRVLVRDPLFNVEECNAPAGASVSLTQGQMQIIACLHGEMKVCFEHDHAALAAGEFCLVPAACEGANLQMASDACFLRITAG